MSDVAEDEGGMIRRGKTYAIPEPIAGCRESDSARPDGQREDFADDYPCAWAPSTGEEEDVDANKGDLGSDRVLITTIRGTDDCHDEFADQHSKCAPYQESATTEFFDGVEGDWRRADINQCSNQADQKRVVNGAQFLEERGAEIEDKVDACAHCKVSIESMAEEGNL